MTQRRPQAPSLLKHAVCYLVYLSLRLCPSRLCTGRWLLPNRPPLWCSGSKWLGGPPNLKDPAWSSYSTTSTACKTQATFCSGVFIPEVCEASTIDNPRINMTNMNQSSLCVMQISPGFRWCFSWGRHAQGAEPLKLPTHDLFDVMGRLRLTDNLQPHIMMTVTCPT